MLATRPKPNADPTAEGRAIASRRHPEWSEHQLDWRFLLDSLESGRRYRMAVYGSDSRGMPVRNLVRHKHEYPEPREGGAPGVFAPLAGSDPNSTATDDDYGLRLARTPTPTFVKEVICEHLDRVYGQEVVRDGPDALASWWEDVDGRGTPIDRWMRETVAPALAACGQVDVCLDHPPAPEGEPVESRADVVRLGLDRCLGALILPENLVWWKLDPAGARYVECLVREFPGGESEGGLLAPMAAPAGMTVVGPAEGEPLFRHWTESGWTLYAKFETKDAFGRKGTEDLAVASGSHAFGRVPIVRLFATRKARCANIGQSDYAGIAEKGREYYNLASELVLSDTLQAHPLLQGPEDFVQEDGSIPVGPGFLLPMKKGPQGDSYQGFGYIDPPKGAAESLRANMQALRDEIDREAALCKPAGAAGAGTVSQSGYSKAFDNQRLNGKLSSLADALAAGERSIAELALAVLGDGEPKPADLARVKVDYSKQFDLTEVDDLGSMGARILELVAAPAAALLPTFVLQLVGTMQAQALPGRDDKTYEGFGKEVEEALAEIKRRADAAEAAIVAPPLAMTASVAPAQATPTQTTPLDPANPNGTTGPAAAAAAKTKTGPKAKVKAKA